jgi:hypothetical protein
LWIKKSSPATNTTVKAIAGKVTFIGIEIISIFQEIMRSIFQLKIRRRHSMFV